MKYTTLFLLLIMIVLGACNPDNQTLPSEAQSALRDSFQTAWNFPSTAKVPSNPTISSAQRAKSPQNYPSFEKNVEEAWCIVISPAIQAGSYREIKNFYLYRIGKSWKVISSYSLYLKTNALSAGCTNYDDTNEFGNTAGVLPTSTPAVIQNQSQNTDYDGWRIFVTNVHETTSTERGWKNIVMDVVFESVEPQPYPLYYEKSVSILDSTGNWRTGDLCCSFSGAPDEVIRVPTGIRFVLASDPIKIPETADIEQIEVRACGSSGCDPRYAIFTAQIGEITTDADFTYPFDTLTESVPVLSDEPVTVNIPGITNAKITFLPGITLTYEDWISMDFEITIENLIGENLKNWQGNIRLDWLSTSVQDNGTIFVYEIYCTDNGGTYFEIPPGYTDTLQCHSVVTFEEKAKFDLFAKAKFDVLWIGFSTEDGGKPFLQTVIGQ